MRSATRNALATPDTTGVSSGATAAAVATFLGSVEALAAPTSALVGSLVSIVVIVALAGGIGTVGLRFVTVGIAVGAVCSAITNLLVSRADIHRATAAFSWTVGSLNGRSDGPTRICQGALALAATGVIVARRPLQLLRFDDSVAHGLGLSVRRWRLGGLACGAALAGVAVAVGGPVGTVALVAPEAARRILRADQAPFLASAAIGAALAVTADLLGRLVFSPVEIPVGILATALGGPVVLAIILSEGRT